MELVLLYRFLGERRNLFFGLSLVFRKSPPFANDFSARIVVCFHVCGSLVRPTVTYDPRQIGRSSNGGCEAAAK